MRELENLNAFQKVQIKSILDENKERDIRLKPVRDYLKERYIIDSITEMNDYQIAKVRNKHNGGQWLYPTFINYKPLHEMGIAFDQAVLICLSHKYDNNRSDAETYIARILNANFDVEEVESDEG